MKSIDKFITNEIIINKSRFITKLYRVNDTDEVTNILNRLNDEYKDATHICYAYIVDNKKKASDDNEPSGTAGMPILSVLEHNNLNYILAVVIRYFGGIKLGAGGLLRAYSSSISKALEQSNIIELIDGYLVRITFNYDKISLIDNKLKNKNIKYKEYDEDIIYEYETDINNIEEIKLLVNKFDILDKIKIEKTDI